MKKLLLSAAIAVFAMSNINAQDGGQTSKGKILIEANTGNEMLGTTGIYFTSQDGNSDYNVGLDGGYFIMDDLALKVGLGFGGSSADGGDSASAFSYRLGAKYYVNSMIPVTLDLTGASGDLVEEAGETPMWLGVGAGYAWFLGDNVSIEPGIRYNHSLNEDFTDKGRLQINVGFALYF
jgi:opacity protein-like surface antigen